MYSHTLTGRRCDLNCQRSTGADTQSLAPHTRCTSRLVLLHRKTRSSTLCQCQKAALDTTAGAAGAKEQRSAAAPRRFAHGIAAAAAAATLVLATSGVEPAWALEAQMHSATAQQLYIMADEATGDAAAAAAAAAPSDATADAPPASLDAQAAASISGASVDAPAATASKEGHWTWKKPVWLDTPPSLPEEIQLPDLRADALLQSLRELKPPSLPEIKLPNVQLPKDIKLPQFSAPSVSLPSFQMPSLPAQPTPPSPAQPKVKAQDVEEEGPGAYDAEDLEAPTLSTNAPSSAPSEATATTNTAPASTSGAAVDASNSALDVLLSEADAAKLPQLPASFPDLPELQVPKLEKAVLSNGLKVYLLEDHEVPLVRGTLIMRGGQYASPSDKVGLATLAMSVQRAGGSTQHPDGVLDETLEALAASVDMGAGAQALTLDFTCSSEDVSTVVSLWSEVLRSPTLPQSKLDFYKAQLNNILDHQNDNPQAVARRELQKLMYGRDSIYARQPTKAGVADIQLEDVKAFAQKWERPEGAVMGVVGDFSGPEMLQTLESALGSWTGPGGELPAVERDPDPLAPAAQAAGKVFLVDRQGLSQASVAMGEPGVTLLDPDTYALDVLGSIFNSFGGQLFDQIRTREGLAYSVYGGWDSPADHLGIFVGGGETSAPAEFLTGLRRVLGEAAANPPTQERLQGAKDETLNAFVFNFASKANQLQRKLVYDILGLPDDLLFRYKAGIQAVGSDDVLRAAQAHLHPEQQVTVVVADAAAVAPALKAAGYTVVPLELRDP